jgi:hypothetical protein
MKYYENVLDKIGNTPLIKLLQKLNIKIREESLRIYKNLLNDIEEDFQV